MNIPIEQLETPIFPGLLRKNITTLQVNLGYRCNQACHHCHVNAGPLRREVMSRDTLDDVLEFAANSQVTTLDPGGLCQEVRHQAISGSET